MTTEFRSRAAREAAERGYGGPSYWAYLDEHAVELAAYYAERGDDAKAAEMFDRSLAESLRGNDGA